MSNLTSASELCICLQNVNMNNNCCIMCIVLVALKVKSAIETHDFWESSHVWLMQVLLNFIISEWVYFLFFLNFKKVWWQIKYTNSFAGG